MSSKIVPRVARAKLTDEEIRLAALVSIEARRARIAAATAKLEVPASKNHMRSAKLPPRRHASHPAPRHPSPEAWVDTNNCEFLLLPPLVLEFISNNVIQVRKASFLKRPATPRFARQAAAPTAACRNGPDPQGQSDLVRASEETLALHETYGRSYAVHNPAQWDQGKIPCNTINGERLSRKSRPARRLRFREGDVTSTMILSRWMSEVHEESGEESDERSDEVSEPEDISLPKETSSSEAVDEDDEGDWAKAILESLARKRV